MKIDDVVKHGISKIHRTTQEIETFCNCETAFDKRCYANSTTLSEYIWDYKDKFDKLNGRFLKQRRLKELWIMFRKEIKYNHKP